MWKYAAKFIRLATYIFARISIKKDKQNLYNASIFSLRNYVCEYTVSVEFSEPDKQNLFIIKAEDTYTQQMVIHVVLHITATFFLRQHRSTCMQSISTN